MFEINSSKKPAVIIRPWRNGLFRQPELFLFCGLLFFLNIPLFLTGLPHPALFFQTDLPASGKILAFFTHAFVHVSPYHLLIDGIGFFAVYTALRQPEILVRFWYGGCALAGALGLALLSPLAEQVGYCGLSGLAHGLMAVMGLELLTEKENRIFGLGVLLVLMVKAGVEVATGTLPFEDLHPGGLGTPLVTAHAGGILGGFFAFGTEALTRKIRRGKVF